MATRTFTRPTPFQQPGANATLLANDSVVIAHGKSEQLKTLDGAVMMNAIGAVLGDVGQFAQDHNTTAKRVELAVYVGPRGQAEPLLVIQQEQWLPDTLPTKQIRALLSVLVVGTLEEVEAFTDDDVVIEQADIEVLADDGLTELSVLSWVLSTESK